MGAWDQTLEPITRSLHSVSVRLTRARLVDRSVKLLSATLLALSAVALVAAWTSPNGFRVVSATVGVSLAGVALATVIASRRSRIDAITTARWIESHQPTLEQRLVSMVELFAESSGAGRGARLAEDLLDDNLRRLDSWREAELGIDRIPRSWRYLAGALAIFALFLLPLAQRHEPPATALPDAADKHAARAENDTQDDAERQAESVAASLDDKADDLAAGTGGGGDQDDGTQSPPGALQGQLRDLYARSVAGMLTGTGSAPGDEGRRGDPEPGARRAAQGAGSDGSQSALKGADKDSQFKTKPEPGGVLPDPRFARAEADDGRGRPRDPGTDARGERTGGQPAPGSGTKSQPGGEAGSGAANKRDPTGDKGQGATASAQARGGSDDPLQQGKKPGVGKQPVGGPGSDKPKPDGATASGKGTGGAGAGGEAGSGALLAQKPLTLAGGGARQATRFTLTLGAAVGGGERPHSAPQLAATEPTSEISTGARGQQAADQRVRHESVPVEYEAIIKRVFARDP